MPDLSKLQEKAEKYLQQQKFDSALEAYLEIQKHQPNDDKVLLTLGDLSLKMRRTADALRFHSLLVDLYIRRDDVSKAVATCRKILKFSPQDLATWIKMAGLLERSKKSPEALQAYREALSLARAAGATQQAFDCLQRIQKLDPSSVEARVERGETASRARQVKAATAEFLQAARLAQKAGDEARWAELVERAHALDPQNEAASQAAAQLFLRRGRSKEAIALLEPLAQSKPNDLSVLELLADAYVETGDHIQAEPLCWKVYQARPEAIYLLVGLTERLVQSGLIEKALSLAEKLRAPLFQQGKQDDFLKIIERVYATDEENLTVLEMLAGLYDQMNKEDGLHRSLARLFNLYLAGEQYEKAADALQRILDVDPYGEGHHDRLLNLEGHIDPILYKEILARLSPPTSGWKVADTVIVPGSADSQIAESLEDLLIEGEMYHQYQLAPKLKETLEKIDHDYPGAHETNARLRELYEAAGFIPSAAPPAKTAGEPGGPPAQSLEEFKKISEITANIYRESTPQGVAQVAVNEIGRALNATRCWGALGPADRAPTLTVEYCSPGASPSDITAALKLHETLMEQAANTPDGWQIENVSRSSILAPALPEIQKLGIKSLTALPLIDREAPAGLVVVEQCDRLRGFTASEMLLFKSITTQVVTAVNNTKLRRLVRSLSGTNEETGLLPRSSYLDCLLAEAQRAKELSQPLSVSLLEVDNPAGLLKTLGDAGVQNYFRQVSKILQTNLRQNDVAVRYSPCAIAVVFPDTALPQGGLAVEKLRGVLSQVRLDGATSPIFCSAVCDVPLGPSFDAVDGVTEVINRLEATLDQAHKEKGKRVLLSKFRG